MPIPPHQDSCCSSQDAAFVDLDPEDQVHQTMRREFKKDVMYHLVRDGRWPGLSC